MTIGPTLVSHDESFGHFYERKSVRKVQGVPETSKEAKAPKVENMQNRVFIDIPISYTIPISYEHLCICLLFMIDRSNVNSVPTNKIPFDNTKFPLYWLKLGMYIKIHTDIISQFQN